MPGAAGMRVLRDPETGDIIARPTHGSGSLDALPGAGDRSTAPFRSERLPDGTVILHLDGRLMEYEVVRMDSSGRRTMSCVQGAAAAKRVLETPAPAPPARPTEE